LLARADIVSLHARVTPQTAGMMGAAQFARMKPGAYFINTARGPLVDYDALYAALHSGYLGGAGIDCFPEEPPPPDWPLLRLPNVTVTPHIAGSSKNSAERGPEQIVRDVANFFAGRPLRILRQRSRRWRREAESCAPTELLVGLDVGTTGAKALVSDRGGRVLAQAGEEYPTHFPQPGWAEQDPEAWWQAARRVLGEGAGRAWGDAQSIAAIGVSCQAPSLVAVDAHGVPVHPALIWMDRRSEPQCDALRATVDEALIARINGGRIDPYFLAPKLLWLRDDAPHAYARCHTILQANGYIVHKLTGVFSMDSSHGPLTLCFDTARQAWSPTLLDALQLDAGQTAARRLRAPRSSGQ
jgi:hypothetical protein